MSGSSAGLDSSPSSSTDSSSSVCYPSFHHSTSVNPSFTHRRFKRDLKLDLSISCPSAENNIYSSFLSSVGTATNPKNKNKDDEQPGRPSFLFVKVYMEGVPIGRKLDLYALHTYHDLLATLSHMFNTSIYSHEDIDNCRAHTFNCSILTYQDKDRDWMMVGDVPWELFLITVKRLKITNPYCWSHRLPHLCDTNGVS